MHVTKLQVWSQGFFRWALGRKGVVDRGQVDIGMAADPIVAKQEAAAHAPAHAVAPAHGG